MLTIKVINDQETVTFTKIKKIKEVLEKKGGAIPTRHTAELVQD